MRVEEEAVGSPRVWLDALIQIVIRRHLGQMAVVFFLEVFYMFCMFGLNVTHPGKDSDS
jgi:hypothetical protein